MPQDTGEHVGLRGDAVRGGHMESQCEAILKHMEDNPEGITQVEALNEYGCMRLASRINDLRNRGHMIETVMVEAKNRYGQHVSYARYVLREG